jgi:tripartite-type tricarboxylate transporter receptor subunit TctC
MYRKEQLLRTAIIVASVAAALAAMVASIGSAAAQVYPSRPITVILPFAAGGTVDAIPRIMAEHLRASLRQPIIVENVSGAGGTIGTGRVARAAPNGYTLGIGTFQTHVLIGAVYPLQYDLLKDFEPVALLGSSPNLIVARSAVPAKDLKELMAWLRVNNDKVSQGHIGVGGGQHLCGIAMENSIGAHWQFVPYRSAALAMQDLVGGQIDLMCTSLGTSPAMVRSGQVKTYAVTARTRLASAPEIPTVDEAGLPGLYISAWYGLYAPKGTSKDIIDKLNAAVASALADPAVRQRFADLGLEIPPHEQQTPEALGAFQKNEIEKWWPIIKAAGIKAE